MSGRSVSFRLPLFVTPAHECGYLPERSARSAFVDPSAPKSPELLSILSRHGFRRSGAHIYRPECPQCRACVALRIPVHEFRRRRCQRRVWRHNQDLRVVVDRSTRIAVGERAHLRFEPGSVHLFDESGGRVEPAP